MKVALVYDRVNKIGGAERVLVSLHELFPDAPLFTAVYDPKGAPWAHIFTVKPSFLQVIPFARKNHEFFPWLTPLAFWLFDFSSFYLVISVTSAEAKNIRTKPETVHLCYCLTPTRYLWSGFDAYAHTKRIASFFLKVWAPLLRRLDIRAAKRPDSYIAISNHVKKRIEKYYNRSVDVVIYPPVETDRFFPKKKIKKGDYYLFVSRLVGYKRADIVIHACQKLHVPLIVIGSGKEITQLKKNASSTIQFIDTYLTDDKLARYYQNCRAFLFAGDEDFGIVAAEAQSAGAPVIAYKNSGVGEIVVDGVTGVLFDEQSVEGLIGAIQKFETLHILPSACIKQAEKFRSSRFQKEIAAYIHKRINQV